MKKKPRQIAMLAGLVLLGSIGWLASKNRHPSVQTTLGIIVEKGSDAHGRYLLLLNDSAEPVAVPNNELFFAWTEYPDHRGEKVPIVGPGEMVILLPQHGIRFPMATDIRFVEMCQQYSDEAEGLAKTKHARVWLTAPVPL